MASDPLSVNGAIQGMPTPGMTPQRPHSETRPVEAASGAASDSSKTSRAGGEYLTTLSNSASLGSSDPNAKESENKKTTAEQLSQAVENLNEMMRRDHHVLTFQLHEDSNEVVIRVVDEETDEVIRQIPSEETLKFAEYVEGLVGMIFNDEA